MATPANRRKLWIIALGASAARVPRFEAPNWLVRLAATGIPRLRDAVPQLGRIRRASNRKAVETLGWKPRANDEIIMATADSLLKLTPGSDRISAGH